MTLCKVQESTNKWPHFKRCVKPAKFQVQIIRYEDIEVAKYNGWNLCPEHALAFKQSFPEYKERLIDLEGETANPTKSSDTLPGD